MSAFTSAVKNKKSVIIRLSIALITTFFFVYFIATNFDKEDFKTLISNINIYYLLIAFGIYFICYIIRSFRILILLKIKFNEFYNMLFIISRSYFLNKILPLKIGELALIYFLKNEQNISYPKAFGAFLYLRVLDLLVVPLFFVFAYIINLILFFNTENMFLLFIFVFVLALLVIIFIYMGKILFLIKRFLLYLPKKIKFFNRNLYNKFTEKYENFTDETNKFLKLKTNFYMIGLTILIRFSILLVMYIIVLGFGVQLSFYDFIIGSTFAALAETIPLSGIGSFGLFEAGWTLGFVFMNYELKAAFISGFGVNMIIFIFTIIMLIISFFFSKTFINFIKKGNTVKKAVETD